MKMNKKENEKLCAVVFDMMTMLIGTMLNEKRLLYTCTQKSEFFLLFCHRHSSQTQTLTNTHSIYITLCLYTRTIDERELRVNLKK